MNCRKLTKEYEENNRLKQLLEGRGIKDSMKISNDEQLSAELEEAYKRIEHLESENSLLKK